MILLMAHAPTRADFISRMKLNGWMRADGTVDHNVQIDEIGPTYKDGVKVDGWHANIRIFLDQERSLLKQKATEEVVTKEVTEEVILKEEPILVAAVIDAQPIFKDIVLVEEKQLVEVQATASKVPAGYADPNGVRFFDPSVVKTPYRTWQ